MNLRSYCLTHGGTAKRGCPVIEQLAVKAECSAGTLYMITTDNKKAGPKLANAIERVTEGAVTRYELREDIFGTDPAKQGETA